MPKYYGMESLKEINASYDHEHGIVPADVDIANNLVLGIHISRDDETPQVGDIVEHTDKFGNYNPGAHIEHVMDGELNICSKPYVPFIFEEDSEQCVSTSTSGGPWANIPSNLKLIGKRMKTFKTWGIGGPRGNGAFYFEAEVNVWEYSEAESEYTTKDYDKFTLHINREPDKNHQYPYTVEGAGSFDTADEFYAWLNTFKGVIHAGAWPNMRTIWTHKQERKCIPLEEYQAIENAVVDTELCNGRIQECKRIYEGTTVTTYLPFQSDLIEMPGKPRYRNEYKKANEAV